MTKEEKIKEAYNDLGIPFNKNILYDGGWTKIKPTQFSSKYEDLDLLKLTNSVHSIRPKSLSGIENNNGWIKIESESDLPDDDDKLLYEVCLFEDGIFKRIYEVFSWQAITRIWEGTAQFYSGKISHYKAIENSKPPIY
jgi:hypothetical protein